MEHFPHFGSVTPRQKGSLPSTFTLCTGAKSQIGVTEGALTVSSCVRVPNMDFVSTFRETGCNYRRFGCSRGPIGRGSKPMVPFWGW